MSSNNSFKPNLLRYTKVMAERACHGFASTTQVGLTQALGGATERSSPLSHGPCLAGFPAPLALGVRGRGSKENGRFRFGGIDSSPLRCLRRSQWEWASPTLRALIPQQGGAAAGTVALGDGGAGRPIASFNARGLHHLTIRSSRSRFAARLNSGVRRQGERAWLDGIQKAT